jgi:DNA-binding CsgD family transcriptional regulator
MARPTTMPGADYRSLLLTIDKLYAAAVEPAKWGNFLGTAAALFQADNAFVCQAEDRRRPFDYIGLDRIDRSGVPVSRYEMDKDLRCRAFNASNGRAVHCRMGVSEQELHASPVYRDYLRPLGIEYSMVVTLPTAPGFTHDLGFSRDRKGQPFDRDDCELLNELVPHLSRGFTVMRAIRDAGRVPPPRAVSPAPAAQQIDAESIRQRFGLTPAQAQLTMLICSGKTVTQAAALLDITAPSARQYLHRIFDRTGVRRQADLVRVVTS